MIRLTLLTLLVAYLSVYAWKNWFRAACWLVLLMSIFQHPDMPKAIADIPGLNHWNFLFLNTVFSWLINRRKEKLSWELPPNIKVLFFLYSLFIFIGVFRYFNDHSGVTELLEVMGSSPVGKLSALNEYLFNCFKWVMPGIIIFDGCLNRKRFNFAVFMLAAMFVILALQVVKAMKLGSLTMGGDALQVKALKIISNSVGFHRVNISMIMSGAFWAVFSLKELVSTKRYWFVILPSCLIIFLAMALTGGRTGYGTWAILGGFYCLFKWRKYLLLAPVVFLAITIFAPSSIERLTQGFSSDQKIEHSEVDFKEGDVDLYSVTSGRVFVWPLVWESILDAPFFGYGREAMQNTGTTLKVMHDYGDSEIFPHPHNAYLQWIQDNGFIGAVPVFLLFYLLIKYSFSLFLDNSNKIYVTTGALSLGLLLAFLIASTGSQTFYPREGAVGMWVAIGLLLRVHVERNKKRLYGTSSLIDS